MKRILLRSAKDPFQVASHELTSRENLIANNTGNLVFSSAAHKLLWTAETEVESLGISPPLAQVDEINEKYDVFVVPMANAFRLSFEPALNKLTRFIERLRIPVVVLGVGGQAGLDYNADRLKPIEESVTAFARAVLDRSATIGVRGEFTEKYLRGLGFSDVEVIGCPSMFFRGPNLPMREKLGSLDRDAPIALNLSPYTQPHRAAMARLVAHNAAAYPNLTYVAQDHLTLDWMLWGKSREERPKDVDLPVHPEHPFYRNGRMRMYVDPWPWMDYLSERQFSFGTRIHGNISAILAGTPAHVLVHDARTLELAEYFDIPHTRISELPADGDASEMYARTDPSAMVAGHAVRFENFASFLARHDLRHVYQDGEDSERFDARVSKTNFAPALLPVSGEDTRELLYRMRWLADENARLGERLAELERQSGRAAPAAAPRSTALPTRLVSGVRRRLRHAAASRPTS